MAHDFYSDLITHHSCHVTSTPLLEMPKRGTFKNRWPITLLPESKMHEKWVCVHQSAHILDLSKEKYGKREGKKGNAE